MLDLTPIWWRCSVHCWIGIVSQNSNQPPIIASSYISTSTSLGEKFSAMAPNDMSSPHMLDDRVVFFFDMSFLYYN